MVKDLNNSREIDLLPVWQRIAWMAAIWTVSVGAMVLATIVVRAWVA